MKKRALMLREPQHERGGACNERATDARAYRWLAVAIVLLAIVPYLNSLQGEFTFDDLGMIRDNPRISGPQAAAAPLLTTVHHSGAWYRPLTMLTYLANVRLGGAPWTFRLANLLLHALVSLAVLAQGQRERAAIRLQRVTPLIDRRPEFGDLLTGARLVFQTAEGLTVEHSLATVAIAVREERP